MAARKKAAAHEASTAPRSAPASSADDSAQSSAEPHVHSVGKTLRLRQARLCPGGNPIDQVDSVGDGCGRCPSVADCTVARFNPKA